MPRDETQLRLVCGVVAGLGFGFHGVFWNLSLIVESAALGLLMMSIVLCLLLRWGYAPGKLVISTRLHFVRTDSHCPTIAGVTCAGAPFVVLFLKPPWDATFS